MYQALSLHLLHELEKGPGTVIPFAKSRVELENRALQQTQLGSYATIGQDLQRAPDVRKGLREGPRLECRAAGRVAATAARGSRILRS